LISTAVLPSFVAVTTWGALFVPTFWLLNLRPPGETLIAVALPESSITWGFDDALSLIVINPVCVPADFG